MANTAITAHTQVRSASETKPARRFEEFFLMSSGKLSPTLVESTLHPSNGAYQLGAQTRAKTHGALLFPAVPSRRAPVDRKRMRALLSALDDSLGFGHGCSSTEAVTSGSKETEITQVERPEKRNHEDES
jgi:hypothetical protein